ncbi:MAG: hypothetical protein JW818_22205 [Pirellulales bacterium]|nr:hypothetical protein [Pirellulales bacterium]
MKVRELIHALDQFDPDADVRLSMSWPEGVTETHERVRLSNYGGGPLLSAALDLRGIRMYVGCVLDAPTPRRPHRRLDLGQYDSPETAARVRDFYITHQGLDEPLNYPDFDYDKWIPPRTTSGNYNPHIAEILREKLLKE